MKILVIGGSGYLGSVLTRTLLSDNNRVDVIDTMLYNTERIQNVKYFKRDIRDFKEVNNIIKNNNYNVIIHLAAIVGDQACDIDADETTKINVTATKNIVDSCVKHGVKALIFASSCSVYGSRYGEVIDEDSEVKPISLYAKTKIECEEYMLNKWSDTFTPVIFRMGTLYGMSPRMRFDLVINLLVAKAMNKEPLTVYGGNQFRPFVHVQDASNVYHSFCKLLFRNTVSGGVYNLVGENKKIIDVAGMIRNVLPNITVQTDESVVDKRNYFVISRKLKRGRSNRDLWLRVWTIERGINEIIKNMSYLKIDYKDPIHSNFKTLHDNEEVRRMVYTKEPIF